MKYKKSDTLFEKINKRINEINKSFENKKKSDSPRTREGAQKFIERFSEKQADTLYKHIPDYAKAKYAGIDEEYTVNAGIWQEYLVKEWLDKINLAEIKPTERKSDIFQTNRTNNGTSGEESEKIQCRNLKYNKNIKMGELLDFQIPLKARKGEQEVYKPDHKGELDLVARQGKEMVLIEYKIPNSTEPLLRAVLEAITYFHQIDGFNPSQSKYLQSFNETFLNKDDKSTWCNAIGLAIVVPEVAYRFGHKRAYALIEKYHIKCYEFESEKDFENIKLLEEKDVADYRNQAEKNLEGIYQNSDFIVANVKLI